jgi:basic membrane protein A
LLNIENTIIRSREMKKQRIGLLALAAVVAFGTAACSSGGSEGAPSEGGKGKFSIAMAIPGALGDQGFYDDAQRGIETLEADGRKTTTLQAEANNPAQWKANVQSISTGTWDLAVIAGAQLHDILNETAPKVPNQNYLIYDDVVEQPNVASIVFKQNEGSFLAGVLAALATTDTSNFPLSSGSKTVGVVGGLDIPVINDFVVGFQAGAQAVDPEIEVLVSYVGSFGDSAKGYDQAKAMYSSGADVVFQVAGGSGIGVLQAAKDANKYAIGVDQNQNALQPGHVLASMLKNVGHALVLAIEDAEEGKLEYGTTIAYGLSNDGVEIDFADNGDLVPQAVVDEIDAYKQQVIDGKIKVPSASE